MGVGYITGYDHYYSLCIWKLCNMIQRGMRDMVITGGSETAITPITVAGFNSRKALNLLFLFFLENPKQQFLLEYGIKGLRKFSLKPFCIMKYFTNHTMLYLY